MSGALTYIIPLVLWSFDHQGLQSHNGGFSLVVLGHTSKLTSNACLFPVGDSYGFRFFAVVNKSKAGR